MSESTGSRSCKGAGCYNMVHAPAEHCRECTFNESLLLQLCDGKKVLHVAVHHRKSNRMFSSFLDSIPSDIRQHLRVESAQRRVSYGEAFVLFTYASSSGPDSQVYGLEFHRVHVDDLITHAGLRAFLRSRERL